MRPKPLIRLLHSVRSQTLLPSQVIIVDGSLNDDSLNELKTFSFNGLEYFKVGNEDRGLTKQRNFGIDRVSEDIDVVAFLDDDIVLTKSYFKNLIEFSSKSSKTSCIVKLVLTRGTAYSA